ncbi:MAG: DNA repair protein RecO [Candidatus Paceibacterota bacterium]|jgi:DNA repair protein RecO (recombination protein O)
MHHIYHTEGFIVSGNNLGEANKFINIFTRDFGMISVFAQGIRKTSSKLKFSLQDFSYSKIDIVRGKDFWRITNAEKLVLLENLVKDEKKFLLVAKIFKLLKRLCHGEEKNEELFEKLIEGFNFLEKENLNEKELGGLEIILVLKTLFYLGYLDNKNGSSVFVDSLINKNLIEEVELKKRSLILEINKSLQETQL